MSITIDGITHRGEGVARINNKAVFIPFAIPGETVNVDIISENKRFSRAVIKSIEKVSKERVEPLCPHFYTCGGCVYQHVSYEKQLRLKQRVVEDSIRRIGKINTQVNPVIGMDYPWRYRNKVTWHVFKDSEGYYQLGFYRYDTNKLFPVHTCKLIPEKIENISSKLQKFLNKIPVKDCTQIIIRTTNFNEVMIIFYGEELKAVHNDLIEIMSNYCNSIYLINKIEQTLLYGNKTIKDLIGNIKYEISPLSFFQVNSKQTENLFSLVLEFGEFNGNENILDAYCGLGAISLYIADNVNSVTGIESYDKAVKDAEKNAKLNNKDNCTFITGQAEMIMPKIKEYFNIIIIDPPRSGCDRELLLNIAKAKPEKVIYVSCNPSTLARDLAILTQYGYITTVIQPVDMFAQTHHTESVARIERVKG